MATVKMFDGEFVTFSHPSQLPQQCAPRRPQEQPIASWSADLTTFQAMCTASDFFGALRFLRANWMYAKVGDVPGGGVITAFKAYIKKIYGPGGPYAYHDPNIVPIAETSGGTGTGAGLPTNLFVQDGTDWRN